MEQFVSTNRGMKGKEKKMVIATTYTCEVVENEGTRENGTSTGSELTTGFQIGGHEVDGSFVRRNQEFFR